MTKFTVGLVSVLAFLGLCGAAGAMVIDINAATAFSFQDEGTTNIDQTSLLNTLDGSWAPTTIGSVTYDYYATGTSDRYFDAVSLNFDLSGIGWENIQTATLRFYTQKGNYANASGSFNEDRNKWQHYEVLDGAFNPFDQDFGPFNATGPIVDFGSTILDPDATVGWLEASIDTSWITSDNYDVTLRLWNARIDKVELGVAPVPEPTTMLLLGTGLACLAGFGRKRFRKI